MRKLLITLGILFMVGILAAPVFAHRWGMGGYGAYGGPGNGPRWLGGGNLTDSQQAEMNKLQENFVNDTAKLREQIWNKSSELDRVLNSETPDANRVKTLQKEISDLQAKMADKRVEFELQARKIAPNAGFGRGYGRAHGMGYGMGYGMGQHYGPYGHRGPQYGQGYGPCWQ
ncbi:MAG: Spy/CpxP family protein refolding chaperone [Deltaproteobacteria bacterium]